MVKIRRLVIGPVVFVLAAALPGVCSLHAGELFFDDFSDGNARDGQPVTWEPMDPDLYDAVVNGGRLEIHDPTGARGVARVVGSEVSNVSIRSQCRTLDEHSIAGIAARYDPDNPYAGYGAAIDPDGMAQVSILGEMYEVVDDVATDFNLFEEDVLMQLDVIADRISFWAWSVGSPMPLEPLLQFEDDLIMAGNVAVGTFGWEVDSGATISCDYVQAATEHIPPDYDFLQAGDADQDLDFDQFDLVQVQQAAKYLATVSATWGEGDWNGAPGGNPGDPPPGNGLFDQLDIIAALAPGHYLTGPYAAIQLGGHDNDGQTSVIYNARTGELAVDASSGSELTSINIDSASGIFIGEAARNLGGSFDNDVDDNIFKATFGSSFGSLSFGTVAQAGLSEQFVLNDLTVVGSLAGGVDLGEVDLIYVPEPTSVLLLLVGILGGLLPLRSSNR